MKINREQLLKELESVTAGLSTREIIEQSSCFVFSNGTVMTFNDDVACTHKSSLKVTGAVQAEPLLAVLQKLKEDTLNIDSEKTEKGLHLTIKGKGRKTYIRMEEEIALPINEVEKPSEWQTLPDDFVEAVRIVKDCAGKDETQFRLTCIRITPKWIEACNAFQMARWKIKLPIENPILIRSDSIRHIVSLGMTEFAETDSWIHFRNDDGLILSCRRYVEDYENLTKIIKFTGTPVQFPKNLVDAIDIADVFSRENVYDNQVEVQLRNNKLKLIGKGVNGRHEEIKKVKYTGKDLGFCISPEILSDITQKHNKAEITDSKLKIKTGKYVYVTALTALGE